MSRMCYSKNDNDNSKKHCGNNSKIAHPILLSIVWQSVSNFKRCVKYNCNFNLLNWRKIYKLYILTTFDRRISIFFNTT